MQSLVEPSCTIHKRQKKLRGTISVAWAVDECSVWSLDECLSGEGGLGLLLAKWP